MNLGQLKKSIDKAIQSLPKKGNTLPILDNILVEWDSFNTVITAGSSEVMVKVLSTGTTFNLDIIDKKSVVIDPKKIKKILMANKNKDGYLDVTEKNCLRIEVGKTSYTRIGQAAELYPPTPDFDMLAQYKLRQVDLSRALKSINHAHPIGFRAPYEPGGFLLTHPNLDDKVAFMTTDGHRLALAHVPKDPQRVQECLDSVLDTRVAKLLEKNIPCQWEGEAVSVVESEKWVQFSTRNMRVWAKRKHEDPIPYKEILPTGKYNFTVTKKALAAALKAVIVGTEDFDKVKPAKFQVSGGQLSILYEHEEGAKAKSIVDVEDYYNGITWGPTILNLNYMLAAANGAPHDKVTIDYDEPMAPLGITDSVDREDYMAVVMPLEIF